ncbi:MAG: hypothetical protein K8F91_17225 [Candidatus Obscuribacterales bacterium]|nr:hypothetical protein [Candidatus Obscuribacterales bacterium]
MTRFTSLFLALFLTATLAISPAWSRERKKELKIIAPDLIVESFEFGEFRNGPEEVPPEKEKFAPTTSTKGGWVGYRLKLKTTRKKVRWYHQIDSTKGKEHTEDVCNGSIYFKWPIVDGYPRGRHLVKGWLERIELPAAHFTVQ